MRLKVSCTLPEVETLISRPRHLRFYLAQHNRVEDGGPPGVTKDARPRVWCGVVQGRRLGREISVSASGSMQDTLRRMKECRRLLDTWTSILDTFGETLNFHTLSDPVAGGVQVVKGVFATLLGCESVFLVVRQAPGALCADLPRAGAAPGRRARRRRGGDPRVLRLPALPAGRALLCKVDVWVAK